MKDIIQALQEWGCDTGAALERFDQDKDLYVECLKIFATDENFTLLKNALVDDKVEEAFNAAHALKGVSGNLSLGNLYQNICSVSDALKIGDLATAKIAFEDMVRSKEEYDKIVTA